MMDIASRLKTTRESKGMSVYKLSQLTGISTAHIRDLEGGRKNPSFDTLDRIAEQLGLNLSDLLNENNEISYLNSNEKELIECYRLLSEDKAISLLNFLKTLAK